MDKHSIYADGPNASWEMEAFFQSLKKQSNPGLADNASFPARFEHVKQTGYLRTLLPKAFGGTDMTSEMVIRQLRRLAYHAPALATVLNRHFIWTGLAAERWRDGDPSLEWLLREARAGKIFFAGQGDTGKGFPDYLLPIKAEKILGGYRFFGKQVLGSLSPAWSYLSLYGHDLSVPNQPRHVFAFLARDSAGYYEIRNGMLGMQAMKLNDTIYLEGVYIPDQYIVHVGDFRSEDKFVSRLSTWSITSLANLYLGQAMQVADQIRKGLDDPKKALPDWKTMILDLDNIRHELDGPIPEKVEGNVWGLASTKSKPQEEDNLAARCQALLKRATDLALVLGQK